jgi:hypothetical protein
MPSTDQLDILYLYACHRDDIGQKIEEFLKLLAAFGVAYQKRYPSELTLEGTPRQRCPGGGAKGALRSFADKLLFILVYQKTHPLQTRHALQYGMSQPQAHYWIHHLLPVLQEALDELGMAPEREAADDPRRRLASHDLEREPGQRMALHAPRPGGIARSASVVLALTLDNMSYVIHGDVNHSQSA